MRPGIQTLVPFKKKKEEFTDRSRTSLALTNVSDLELS
jgi:hypothetical protein